MSTARVCADCWAYERGGLVLKMTDGDDALEQSVCERGREAKPSPSKGVTEASRPDRYNDETKTSQELASSGLFD